MNVYHFLSAKWGLEAISKRRLKISRMNSLNDPFEFISLNCREKEFLNTLKTTIKDLDLNFGLICFSANNSNPVKWSHYADRHKGICLGFDVPIETLDKVDYINERIEHAGNIDEQAAKKLLRTKYKHWSYEEEYRAFIELEEKDGEHYFSSFNEKLKLISIAVGSDSTISRGDINNALGDLKHTVKAYKTRLAFKSFKIVENNCQSLWT